MTQMDPIKRQMMQGMIEFAAKDQQKQLAWVNNLYQQRLKMLQESNEKYQATINQPEWVCSDCGQQWGLWWEVGKYIGPEPHVATFHLNKCDVCSQQKSVTEARDFGYLRKGWGEKLDD